MAAALVLVPAANMFRTGFVPMVWPITAPLAHIHRSGSAPTIPSNATVQVPKASISRAAFAPDVNHFSPATAVITFAITRSSHRFYITRQEVTPG